VERGGKAIRSIVAETKGIQLIFRFQQPKQDVCEHTQTQRLHWNIRLIFLKTEKDFLNSFHFPLTYQE
jgi:hypothetical protein